MFKNDLSNFKYSYTEKTIQYIVRFDLTNVRDIFVIIPIYKNNIYFTSIIIQKNNTNPNKLYIANIFHRYDVQLLNTKNYILSLDQTFFKFLADFFNEFLSKYKKSKKRVTFRNENLVDTYFYHLK